MIRKFYDGQAADSSGGSQSNVKVQAATCPKCELPILITVTETKFSRETSREFAKLMEEGFGIKMITLEEARTTDMCFDKTHWNNN